MYTFSNRLKTFSIALIIIGAIGVVYGFMTSHKSFEDVETMLAAEAAHGGGHGEEAGHEVATTHDMTTETAAHGDASESHVDEHKKHVEHVQHQMANRPWSALYVAAFFLLYDCVRCFGFLCNSVCISSGLVTSSL